MKTRLIIYYMAQDAKNQQSSGFVDAIIEEDPAAVTTQSSIDTLLEGLKPRMATAGFICQMIIPTGIVRIAADVERPLVQPDNTVTPAIRRR